MDCCMEGERQCEGGGGGGGGGGGSYILEMLL